MASRMVRGFAWFVYPDASPPDDHFEPGRLFEGGPGDEGRAALDIDENDIERVARTVGDAESQGTGNREGDPPRSPYSSVLSFSFI